MSKSNSTIYVGNLPDGLKEQNLEDLFEKYGRIVDIQFERGRGYAYIEFGYRRDALEAIEGCNGRRLGGCKLEVEFGHGLWGPGPAVPRHTPHKVIIKNLPPSATWQELKVSILICLYPFILRYHDSLCIFKFVSGPYENVGRTLPQTQSGSDPSPDPAQAGATCTGAALFYHMKMAGTVCFADICHDGHNTTGVVEYIDEEVMQYAIRKLTNSEFKNRLSRNVISVEKYDGSDLAKDKGGADKHKRTVPSSKSSDRQATRSYSKHSYSSSRNSHRGARSERKDAHSPSRRSHRSTRSERKHPRSPSRSPTLPTKRTRI